MQEGVGAGAGAKNQKTHRIYVLVRKVCLPATVRGPRSASFAEQKLEVAANELDQAQKDAEGKEGELKEAIDIQKAVLSSLGMRIQDLEKEAFEFKRDIVLGAENARTGKIMAEKLTRWMDERLKSKDAVIEKLRLKNSTLRTRIAKLKSQLKQKQEVGGVLHYIDFHQLQIENKQYLARIEERNTQLLDLKVSTGATVQTLNALKQRLGTLVAECAWRRQEIRTRQERLGKLDGDIDSAHSVVSKHKRMAERLQVAVEQAEDMPAVPDYVRQREEHSLLEKEVKNWQRKVEIADMASKRAKALMRKSQRGQLGASTASGAGSTVAFGGSMTLGGTALSATSVQATPFGTKRRGGLYTGVALANSGVGKK